MKKQDVLSILITFSMGVVAGIYVYLTGFTAILYNFTASEEERANRFIIQGEAYGECGSICPSFQVKADGSYRYLYTPEVGQSEVLREGELSRSVKNGLRRTVRPAALFEQSRAYAPSECLSDTNGVDVRYEINLEGTDYEIDSCGTAVDWNSGLWTSLNAVWEELGQTGNN